MLYVYMYICTCILHYAQSGLNGAVASSRAQERIQYILPKLYRAVCCYGARLGYVRLYSRVG